MIFETRCAGCDRPGAAICTTCRFSLTGRGHRPFVGVEVAGERETVLTAVAFTGRARDIVLSLKYRNRRQAARHLAGLVVNRLVEAGLVAELDVVTWAPTSTSRRRRRGFDQGELLASTIAGQLGLPCRKLLTRQGRSAPQTGRSRVEREHAVTFLARPHLDGRRVLVVDDVVTTGATLLAASRALRVAGAADVIAAAVAATPTRSSAGDRTTRSAPASVATGPARHPVRRPTSLAA